MILCKEQRKGSHQGSFGDEKAERAHEVNLTLGQALIHSSILLLNISPGSVYAIIQQI